MHKVLVNVMAGIGLVTVMAGSAAASSSPVVKASPLASPKVAAQEAKSATPQPPTPKTHEVQAGDSLSTIADSEQLESWRPLWNANPDLQDPDLIYAGQKLTVPQGPTEDRPVPQAAVSQVAPVQAVSSTRSGQRSVATNYAAGSAGVFERIRQRESGGNYAANTGNGYYGAYQFSLGTWRGVGGSGLPSEASPAEQDMRAQMLYERRGCSPWPNTCY